MAYEVEVVDIQNALDNSRLDNSSRTVFSSDTISKILALATNSQSLHVRVDTVTPDSHGEVTVQAGVGILYLDSSDTVQTVIKAPVNVPVVIFQGRGGVIATFNDGGSTVPSGDQLHVDRVIVGSAGNDHIVIGDAKNSQITLGTGDSIVSVGHGVDTVEAGLGNSTIIGGNGDYAVVKLAGNATNYHVTTQDGHAIITDATTHKTTDISKIQYVQLDNGNALVFAKNSVEAQVGTLYHVAMGREADAGGLDYWFDAVKAGATLKQIASAFVNSTEFSTAHSGQSDTAFIQSMYQNTFNRAGEDSGVAFWQNALSHGSTRADLINSFAQIAVQNIEGISQTEIEIVGNVHIVTNII